MAALYDLLGTEFACAACGRTHRVALREVLYDADAVEALPEVCARYAPGGGRRLMLMADERTYAAAGRAARRALVASGFSVQEVLVPDPSPDRVPVCDDITRAALEQRIEEADLYVAVGSGVISDLTKWIAGDRGIPYVAFASAASMNGYASDNIAPTVRGVKRLLYGRGPAAVVAAPQVLIPAPAVMTGAGLGDVMAKPVSASDWRLNRVLFDEFYCAFCIDAIKEIEPGYLANPEGIRDGKEPAVHALFDALIYTGIAMSMAGTSAPASGGEHLISHTLDMMSMLDGAPHDLHGRQVGIGTILGAALYQEVMRLERPTFAVSATETDPAFWGRFTEAVEEEHAQKRKKAERAVRILNSAPSRWDAVRAALAPELRSPQAIKDCLRRAGAAHRLQDIGVDRDRFLQALLHAHEIRERYTILDLARTVGILPERAGELVDRWVVT